MRGWAILAVFILLAGCGPRPQAPPGERSAIGFLAAGTGYRSAPARLSVGPDGAVTVQGEAPVKAVLATQPSADVKKPEDALGRSLPLASGALDLPQQRKLEVVRGTLTLQALQAGLARGNFEVVVREGSTETEIRGSFDAEAGASD